MSPNERRRQKCSICHRNRNKNFRWRGDKCNACYMDQRKKKNLVSVSEFQEDSNKASSTSLFKSVMVQSLELSEIASRSKKHHDIAIQGLQKLIAELGLLEFEESNEEFVNSISEVMPKVSDNGIKLCDPPLVATKGRPWTFRMKGNLELLRKGSSTCSYCKKKGHSKRKCPSLNQARCEIINGQISNTNAEASGLVDLEGIMEA